MTDPAVKTALFLCIVSSGVCASLLFRNDQPSPVPLTPDAVEEVPLRIRGVSALSQPQATRQTSPIENREASQTPQDAPKNVPSAIVVTPTSRRESPPTLSPKYPEPQRPVANKLSTMEMMLPVSKPIDETHRTHMVVDGDTLAALAERYLGEASRAKEIFETNRNLLQTPELLPIGIELKIPPRGR